VEMTLRLNDDPTATTGGKNFVVRAANSRLAAKGWQTVIGDGDRRGCIIFFFGGGLVRVRGNCCF
jgi:hypothetical protein